MNLKTDYMRRFFITTVAIILAFTATAQSARELILSDSSYALGVYRLYPTQFKEQTPAPKGYKPFYISHYGRHGSRYVLRDEKYDRAYRVFEDAAYFGKLTPYGKEIYDRLTRAKRDAYGRGG